MSDPIGTDPRYPSKPKPTIIKGATIGSQAERLVKVRRELTGAEQMTRLEQIEAEARKKADEMLARAQAEAEALVGEARKESDSIRRTAREEGENGAKLEALDRIAGLITTLDNECKRLRAARGAFMSTNLPGILEFACAVAKKILINELRTRPEAIADRARTLLERMPIDTPVTLTVSPNELEVIERYLHEAGGPSDTILPALRSDPAIPLGGMRLESDSGMIDAGLLDALEQLGDILVDQARLHNEAPSPGEAPDGS